MGEQTIKELDVESEQYRMEGKPTYDIDIAYKKLLRIIRVESEHRQE
jgi:hypothetical protein